MTDFDRPLFKRLAHNDTGDAVGHQGGILVPKDIADYFPQLQRLAKAEEPTVERKVKVAIFVDDHFQEVVESRYQYQTWGATRTPERRLTSNLGALRSVAKKDDYVTIERSLSNPDYYKLTLYRAGHSGHSTIHTKVGDRRWGPIDWKDRPIKETEILVAGDEEIAREAAPFNMFDHDASLVETRALRMARTQAFNKRVLPLYDHRCAVCGRAHANGNRFEAEAAHIVPRVLKGTNDARNGLALCRSHHWAFDQGLFGVHPTDNIVLRPSRATNPRNAHLLPFEGQKLRSPSDLKLAPSPDALSWHLDNVVKNPAFS